MIFSHVVFPFRPCIGTDSSHDRIKTFQNEIAQLNQELQSLPDPEEVQVPVPPFKTPSLIDRSSVFLVVALLWAWFCISSFMFHRGHDFWLNMAMWVMRWSSAENADWYYRWDDSDCRDCRFSRTNFCLLVDFPCIQQSHIGSLKNEMTQLNSSIYDLQAQQSEIKVQPSAARCAARGFCVVTQSGDNCAGICHFGCNRIDTFVGYGRLLRTPPSRFSMLVTRL